MDIDGLRTRFCKTYAELPDLVDPLETFWKGKQSLPVEVESFVNAALGQDVANHEHWLVSPPEEAAEAVILDVPDPREDAPRGASYYVTALRNGSEVEAFFDITGQYRGHDVSLPVGRPEPVDRDTVLRSDGVKDLYREALETVPDTRFTALNEIATLDAQLGSDPSYG